jgi:hypothetical protein
MFKHQGTSRTLKHNLKLATVLSFVAGIVNVTGFLAIKQMLQVILPYLLTMYQN